MKVLGIIAEYNPFHNGHLYHLRESKELIGADFVVAVMSGNFVQRGEPALLDKWNRARIAVENGIDLVIELPFAFACNNSEMFARGAIDILNGLGCVTHLSFGSEEGELTGISQIAEYITQENEEFKEALKDSLNSGYSFASSRERAINTVLGLDLSTVLRGSNNILGIEYLKQLKYTKSTIIPITIKRKGPEYNEDKAYGEIASATHIRNLCRVREDVAGYLPVQTFNAMNNYDKLADVEDFYKLLRLNLLKMSREELGRVYAVNEGLENKILKNIVHSNNYGELIAKTVSKRYTETRIKRILIQSLLGLNKEIFNNIINEKINYCRILGFNPKGAELLKQVKDRECNTLPLLTNINKEVKDGDPINQLLHFDILASNIYHLAADRDLYLNSDYVKKPFIQI